MGRVSEQRAPSNLSGKSLGKERQYLPKEKKRKFQGCGEVCLYGDIPQSKAI